MRALGTLLIVAWGLQLLSIGLSAFLSMSAKDVPADAWLFLSLHAVIACVGVAGGALALRRVSLWKWFALASGVSLLAIIDFGWYSIAQRAGGVAAFLFRYPHIGYGTLVMPVLALIFALVAGWRAFGDFWANRSSASRGI